MADTIVFFGFDYANYFISVLNKFLQFRNIRQYKMSLNDSPAPSPYLTFFNNDSASALHFRSSSFWTVMLAALVRNSFAFSLSFS